ncbi:MAG: chorismate--pyruvate lyase family protein, partial [Thiobacillaceae bacterium]
RALIREVMLLCDEHPLVFAHSVIPRAGLAGPWRSLSRLGNRPLGEALFADPRIVRHPLQYRRLDRRHPLYHSAVRHLSVRPSWLWARRSVFCRDGYPILVTEVFLPEVLQLNDTNHRLVSTR